MKKDELKTVNPAVAKEVLENSASPERLSTQFLFSVADLKKATKITLFEKVCLWFIKPKYQVSEIENYTVKYKIFRGKMYVLSNLFTPPKHYNCRCIIY